MNKQMMEIAKMVNVVIPAAFSVALIEYGLYLKRKTKNIEALSDKIELDLDDAVIRKGVERAISREVKYKIDDASREAIREVRNEMRSKIRLEIEDEFSDLKSEMKKELKKQVNALDTDRIKREFIEESKSYAAEKFKDDLDDILEKHNEELEKITKIYSAISEKLTE